MALDQIVGTIGRAAAGAGPPFRTPAGNQDSGETSGFGAALGKLIDTVEQTSADANQAITSMLDKTGEVHDAMIALQRAELSLQLTMQIRNKLVQAYQDIMRMPI